jgi:hypothetical protein
MKKTFTGILLMAIAQFASAQVNTATGSVKDDKGNPLHFVFVFDSQYNNAAFSDASGSFAITAHPDSKLKFELAGYADNTVVVGKDNSIPEVILKSGTSGTTNALNTQKNEDDKLVLQRNDENGISGVPVHEKGNTRGSKYLLGDFTFGFFINSSDALVHNKTYWLNYDKINGLLLLTEDGKTINELSWDKTKSFILFDNKDQTLVFERVPAIDNSHYLQVLSSGKKYKIYKYIKTKFVRADFVNNGVTSRGNDYDEYVDDPDYYVADAGGGQPHKITLKKKSLKDGFAKDADRVNKYLADNSGTINDAYLSSLGDFMNP